MDRENVSRLLVVSEYRDLWHPACWLQCTTQPVGLFLFLILLSIAGCAPHPAAADSTPPASQPALQKFSYHAIKLGSDFNVYLYASDKQAADAAGAAVFAKVDALDPVYNDYLPTSEISRLCHLSDEGPMAKPVYISDELFDLLSIARNAAERTDGDFDPTIGPFVQLWRWSKRQQMLPSADRLAAARDAVGWKNLILSTTTAEPGTGRTHTAQLLKKKMRLDLGGIAGGYIADQCLALLRDRGFPQSLIDSSGDLAVGDPPPGKKGWVIAIRDLTQANKTADYIEVQNCGVSTSGDTYRFVEIDGVRYSHIVDHRSGLGMTNRIGVTVIAPNGTEADWLTKPMSLWPAEKSLAYINELDRTLGCAQLPATQSATAPVPSPATRRVNEVGYGARITILSETGQLNVVESQRYKQVKTAPATRQATQP